VAVPCLLFVATANASPIRKAHTRTHKVVSHRRAPSAAQSFARLANRRPEKRLARHPQTWLKSAPHALESPSYDAAIQNVSPASLEIYQETPALQPLEILAQIQAQLPEPDGYAHRSPRAPPSAA
jgi:hypothetical protein